MPSPAGERTPVAQGSSWPSGVILKIQPRQGTRLSPRHHSSSPKATLPLTKKLPSGATFGPKLYSW